MFEYARVNEKKWKKEKNFEWDASVKTNNRMVLSKIRNIEYSSAIDKMNKHLLVQVWYWLNVGHYSIRQKRRHDITTSLIELCSLIFSQILFGNVLLNLNYPFLIYLYKYSLFRLTLIV